MRIVYLSAFPPYRGGVSQFNMSLLSALCKKHSVHVFNFKRLYPNLFFPGESQYEQFERPVGRRIVDTLYPPNWRMVANKINRVKPDYVLTRFWHPILAPCQGAIARHSQAPTIGIIDNVNPHEKIPFGKTLAKYYLSSCYKTIALNEKVKIPHGNAHFIPHPTYNHFGDLRNKNVAKESFGLGDRKVLLFFGFIRDYKGLDILLESMQYLDDSYAVLIAGECYTNFNKYKKMMRGKVVAHTHYIPHDYVTWYFSASDACVLPYRKTSQSGVLELARHYQIPCITTPALAGDVVAYDYSPLALATAIKLTFSGKIEVKHSPFTWEEFADRLFCSNNQ